MPKQYGVNIRAVRTVNESIDLADTAGVFASAAQIREDFKKSLTNAMANNVSFIFSAAYASKDPKYAKDEVNIIFRAPNGKMTRYFVVGAPANGDATTEIVYPCQEYSISKAAKNTYECVEGGVFEGFPNQLSYVIVPKKVRAASDKLNPVLESECAKLNDANDVALEGATAIFR